MKTILESKIRPTLLNEVNELRAILDNDTKHLSDVGMAIQYRLDRISALNVLIFQEHREEIHEGLEKK